MRPFALLTMLVSPFLIGWGSSKTYPPEKYFQGEALTLAHAIARGDVARVDALAPTVTLNASGAEDMTLLYFAITCAMDNDPQQLMIITHLVKAGADPLQKIKDFGSPLGAVLRAESPLFVKAFLDAGVSPDTVIGSTPILFDTVSESTFDTMKLLLDRGATIDKKDSLGNTALMKALTAMQLDQVIYLLERGANPDFVNVNGVSFAGQLQFQIGRQQEGSLAQRKMGEIRDRIIAKGVAWPPLSRDQEQELMRARGQEVHKLLPVD